MGRWLLSSCLLFFFARTKDENDDLNMSGITEAEWKQLADTGLLFENETKALKEHCQRMQQHSIPSFMLLHWSMKLYRKHTDKNARIPDLDKFYLALRKCQEDVVQIMALPMPFQYYHIMNLMLMLNLTLWSYTFGIMESNFAPVVFFFVQLMFQGLRELAVALSDPFGDDETDFPLNEWMTQLYLKIHTLVEDEFPFDKDIGAHQGLLPTVKKGEQISDLLSEVKEHESVGPWRKKRTELLKADAERKKREDAEKSTAAETVDPQKTQPPPSGTGGKGMGKRSSKEEEEEEEEEDDGD